MGARLLPRTLPELFSYALAIEREAAKRYRELARAMRAIGVDELAEELERIGREEEEQHELIELGTSGRKLPDFAGWELCWHYVAAGAPQHAARSPREALASALAFERHTHAFYLDVAESARDDAVRAFSAEMANDEQRHIGRLEVLLEQEPDPAAGAEAANLQFRLI